MLYFKEVIEKDDCHPIAVLWIFQIKFLTLIVDWHCNVRNPTIPIRTRTALLTKSVPNRVHRFFDSNLTHVEA